MVRPAGPGREGEGVAVAGGGVPELKVLEGDCVEVLAELPSASVDAIVTDPPYGIGIKHARWDSQTAIREAVARKGGERLTRKKAYEVWCRIWATECLRVLKPGAYLLAFGSPAPLTACQWASKTRALRYATRCAGSTAPAYPPPTVCLVAGARR